MRKPTVIKFAPLIVYVAIALLALWMNKAGYLSLYVTHIITFGLSALVLALVVYRLFTKKD
jgi:hypothetical protein